MTTKTLHSTITSKGQVTLPVAIRRHLKLQQRDRIDFVLDEQGRVELRVPKYASIASLAGAAGSIGRQLSPQQMRELAYQDRFAPHTEVDD